MAMMSSSKRRTADRQLRTPLLVARAAAATGLGSRPREPRLVTESRPHRMVHLLMRLLCQCLFCCNSSQLHLHVTLPFPIICAQASINLLHFVHIFETNQSMLFLAILQWSQGRKPIDRNIATTTKPIVQTNDDHYQTLRHQHHKREQMHTLTKYTRNDWTYGVLMHVSFYSAKPS